MRVTYPLSTALNVVRKVGGIGPASALAERDMVSVRRWLNLETGGEIPRSARETMLKNAKANGVDLALTDFFTLAAENTGSTVEAA